jgi:TrkA domain protein
MPEPIPAVTERDLPGIGRSYRLHDADGQPVTVVIHHGGRRDVYLGPASRPTAVSLTDDQARRLGAILSGAFFRPLVVAQVEAIIGGLLIDWITVPEHSPARGRSIADVRIRQETRMTVAAILRAGRPLVAPEPDEVLEAGDQLVVMGRPEDLGRLTALLGA